jgi:phage tail sheath protein FI
MPFALSPGVTVIEKDFSSVIPAVSTSAGAFAGVFQWGPVMEPTTITSEDELVRIFGRPNKDNYLSFFTAANFLAYTNNVIVNRVDAAGMLNATSVGSVGVKIRNNADYSMTYKDTNVETYGPFVAKYPGKRGNGIQVIIVDAGRYAAAVTDATSAPIDATNAAIIANFSGTPGTSTQAALKGIANDELHVLVLDSEYGHISGTPNQVLEKYEFMSKLKGVVKNDGTNTHFKTVINNSSKYILAISTLPTTMLTSTAAADINWGLNINDVAASITLDGVLTTLNAVTLVNGADSTIAATDGEIAAGYTFMADPLQYDISLVAMGAASPALANLVIAGLITPRLDCVLFVSPADASVTPIIANGAAAVTAITTWKTTITNSSYVVMDSGWKYQYDRYNDEYRWVPLNGDIAGLCARTDYTSDAWFSPGGFTRGQIKNVVKLGFNPGQAERDSLYNASVNPVVTFPGQGTILYGDKTFMSKPSSFDRINVRRLFIVLEKAISTAAKYQLFEFNDDFTRAQFKNLVEPFLRNVQGRRGITDFVVKCDSTNNTGEVIDANQFVASIFIKPSRSINFITLNFIAARSSVNFSEIGG